MLSPTLDTLRLFLHVLAASVWVGGQIAVAGVVPRLRVGFPDSTRVLARAYGRVAWPAFLVVVVTGLWSLGEIGVSNTTTEFQVTLFLKVALAIASGAAAVVHSVGTSKLALALGGALGLLFALAAMFCGVLLGTAS
jgi:putative copper export protein